MSGLGQYLLFDELDEELKTAHLARVVRTEHAPEGTIQRPDLCAWPFALWLDLELRERVCAAMVDPNHTLRLLLEAEAGRSLAQGSSAADRHRIARDWAQALSDVVRGRKPWSVSSLQPARPQRLLDMTATWLLDMTATWLREAFDVVRRSIRGDRELSVYGRRIVAEHRDTLAHVAGSRFTNWEVRPVDEINQASSFLADYQAFHVKEGGFIVRGDSPYVRVDVFDESRHVDVIGEPNRPSKHKSYGGPTIAHAIAFAETILLRGGKES
ncbi:MAG TPA: hypothetical protein VF183_07255 [Acidimicrobiales bacterium]